MWRGGVGAAYLLPALSLAGASLTSPCFRFHIPLIRRVGTGFTRLETITSDLPTCIH
jgi:hypothetical protein